MKMARISNPRGARPSFFFFLSTLVVAGSLLCSAGASGASATTHKTKSGNSHATSEITANWVAFFKGSTPTIEKISLLQNGSDFASTIEFQANLPWETSVTAKVAKVRVISKTEATLTYTLLLSGVPSLPGVAGEAVYQRGKWKVSDTTYCLLMDFEGNGNVKGCSGLALP